MLAGKKFDSSSIFAFTAVAVASALPLGASSTDRPAIGLPLRPRGELVAQAADLDPRHVAQPHGRAVGVGAQHDRAELVGRRELALDQHHRGNLLGRIAGLGADAAGGDLRVLRADRLGDVVGGEVEADQLGRIDPDAQRALGRIERGAADAGNAADLAQDVAHHEVAEPDLVEAAVGRAQRDDLQHRARSFLDQDALLHHRARQPRLDALDAVLHLDRSASRCWCRERSWR